MKTDRARWLKIAVILLAGVVACVILYFLFDDFFNGVFLDWFTREFTYSADMVLPGSANPVVAERIDWSRLKGYFLVVLLVLVILWLFTLMLVNTIMVRRQRRELLREIARQIREIVRMEPEEEGQIPPEYEGVAAPIERLKEQMRRGEQVLRDEAKQKNDLITYLAHDLKTPLTSVIGYLSLLDEAGDMPKEQREKYVRITLEKAIRLEGLINEFFDITRYNLSQMVLERETIDLSFMLMQMADEFYPLLEKHGNTVESDVSEDLTVYADADKLARVFHNILKNAIAYSYRDTPIGIRARKEGNGVRIEFSNRGKTIPPRRLDAIFDKFFRLDEARTSDGGGAGLGLAIAREIVTLHGGTVTAASADGQTVFTVVLP